MEEKVYALKPSFIQQLHQEWKEDFSNSQHEDFINHINQKYEGNKLTPFLLPGDNGLFIDSEVIFRINTLNKVGTNADWDYNASRILFSGCGNGLGIYQKDINGKRIPLDVVYATDTRVWNYLSLFLLSRYTKNRWGNSSDSLRIFINQLSNAKATRHAIMRLYWTARLCYDPNRSDSLELLKVLWRTNDFMTQITERNQSSMQQQTQWFLDFCVIPENNKVLFDQKSSEGYTKYRKFIKLYLAEDKIYMLADTDKNEFFKILNNLLALC